jgi:hypothetical protein
MPDPSKILLDPARSFDVDTFLLTFKSWASNPASNFQFQSKNVLEEFVVEFLIHNKCISEPQHEFVLVDTKDKSDVRRIFILDLTAGKQLDSDDTNNGETFLGNISKAAILAYHTMTREDESTTSLRALEESTPLSSDALSTSDKLTVAAVQLADGISRDSVEKLAQRQAYNRILGENFLCSKYYGCSKSVNFFKPKSLNLFELVLLANVVHDLYPTYSLLSTQCYFYSHLVYKAARELFGVRSTVTNSYLAAQFGRYGGYKVSTVTAESVSQVVTEYRKVYNDTKLEVCIL